jgi:NitT/TauT family transport system substrate-binding protein
VARAQGLKAKEVAMLHDKSLSGIFFLKGSGIERPKDLEGKTLGDVVGGGARVIFPAFAAANGVDVKKVKEVNLDAAGKVLSLFQRKVDAISEFALSLPVMRDLEKKLGVQLGVFMYSDYGVDTYSNGIVTKDMTLAQNPDRVKRFVHASMKAVLWSLEHPNEAIQIYMKHNPTATWDVTWANWEIFVDHLLTKTAMEKGLGHMTREKMEFTRDVISKHMGLTAVVPVEELYTNEFLPQLFFKKGK